MSVSAIIKALNFFVAQLNKEIDKLRTKADKRYSDAAALRDKADEADREADDLHADADKVSRISAKITNIIQD